MSSETVHVAYVLRAAPYTAPGHPVGDYVEKFTAGDSVTSHLTLDGDYLRIRQHNDQTLLVPRERVLELWTW